MAKAKVALMGSALLAAIMTEQVARITEAQAASLDASHYEVNTADIVDGAALVRLTEAGIAAAQGELDKADGDAAAPAAPAAAPASKASYAIDDDVPMPATRRRAPAETIYPFDQLEVGKSFHIPVSADNPNPQTRVSSSITAAHVRYSNVILGDDGKPVMEDYEVTVYKRDENGEYVKDADGKRIADGKETRTREKRSAPTRTFQVFVVDETDPRGKGARVYRTA